MQIVLELNGLLDVYLPDDAAPERARLEVAPGTCPADVIERLGIPSHRVHLVYVDGRLLAREGWRSRGLREGEVLSMWPLLAGG